MTRRRTGYRETRRHVLHAVGALAHCPDCLSDAVVVETRIGIYELRIEHDETCPLYRSLDSDGHIA